MRLFEFLGRYWWALAVGAGLIVLGFALRKKIIGQRLSSLFSWPPKI